jgi:hypothetical protein
MTTQAGIAPNAAGETFAMGWADVNGDGLPDLWVGRHGSGAIQPPNLYINQGNGTFVDQFDQIFPDKEIGDDHGMAWWDFNNGGLPSFLQQTGAQRGLGSGPKFLYVNSDGQLIDEGAASGLDDALGRGRIPIPFDWNNDGLLDVLMVNGHRPDGQAPTTLFAQSATGFQDVTAAAGLSSLSTTDGTFAEVGDLTGNGTTDLIYFSNNRMPMFFTEHNGVFSLVPNMLPANQSISDMVIADFNNDGYQDVFLTTKIAGASAVQQFTPTQVGAELVNTAQADQGFSFQSTGALNLDVQIGADGVSSSKIFVGSSGLHPLETPLTLDPNNPNDWGIQSHTAGQGGGLYVGYDPNTQGWQVLQSNSNNNQGVVINGKAPITGVTPIGFDPSQSLSRNYLLMYDPATGKLVDKTNQAGLGGLYSTSSVVAGDFTNDMHNDLILTQDNGIASLPNIYFHNNGDGTFTRMNVLPGATTPLGPAYPPFGIGKKIITADYNRDGWLDAFISPTQYFTSANYYASSPAQLLENTSGTNGNTNHWLELNLQGTVSNRDGVGAIVRVTAGGVTQVQDETLGMHHFAQNSAVLHFGLAQNTTVDKVEIDWPSGTVQTLNNVSADQFLTVLEPGGNTLATARTIPVYLGVGPYHGHVGSANGTDFYGFAVGAASNLRVDLFNLTGAASIQLLDASGNVLVQSTPGTNAQELSSAVGTGTYYVSVVAGTGAEADYSMRISDAHSTDTTGPSTSGVRINDGFGSVVTSTPPTVTAWVDDTSTGNNKIVAAEYFVDTVGPVGTGTALQPQEGQFSGPIQFVSATLDTNTFANLSAGNHTLYVRGEDAAGLWGPTTALVFVKGNPATHFSISMAGTVTAGASFQVTVAALNANNTVVSRYRGIVFFSSSDVHALLPDSYSFTAADAGIHTFLVTLTTAGQQTITASDTVQAGINGQTSGITVKPAAARSLQVSGFPASATAGTAYTFTVTAVDAYGNIATGFRGTVQFTSSDAAAVLPANYRFTSTDAGVHVFTATLNTPGTQSLTATDTVKPSLTGTESGITVSAASRTSDAASEGGEADDAPVLVTAESLEELDASGP